jgi:two-component system sensor histidine kinase AgrC
MKIFVTAFLETFAILFIYYLTFSENIINKLIEMIAIILLTSSIFVVAQSLNGIYKILIMLTLLILTISYRNKKKRGLVTLEIIICYIEVFFIELLAIGIVYWFNKAVDINNGELFIVPTLILGVMVIYFNVKLDIKNKVMMFYDEHNIILLIIINPIIYFLSIKLLINNNMLTGNKVVVFITLAIVLVFINISYIFKIIPLLNRKRRLELENTYNPLLNEVIENLKAEKHEYRNHLNVLYTMAQIGDENEIKEHIIKYIGNIKENNKLEQVFYIENVVVKAIIYNLLKEAESLNINVNLSIKSNLNNLLLDDSEVTIILSNLINNAIEALKEVDKRELEIIIDEINGVRITVRNYAPNMSNENLQNIFNKGFSTKGKDRGYGLYNVKKIVKKYKGKIQLAFEDNYLAISIIF